VTRTISLQTARRLAIQAQRLTEPRQPVNSARIYEIVQQIGCLQLDPISAVARSHQIVLWSRLGPFDLAHLDTLLWDERKLFEYWAHAASIVLTEDYPIHGAMMAYYRSSDNLRESTRQWLTDNDSLRQHILDELRQRGPLGSKDFEDKAQADWHSTGWTSGRNVSQMIDHLWTSGELMVAGRKGGQKQWDLSERVLPEWTPRREMTPQERTEQSALKALRALGVGSMQQISQHYVRGRYIKLKDVLHHLESQSRIMRINVEGMAGEWYIHTDDLPALDRIEAGEWTPVTRLLSPFDNLICDRKRTEALFDFYFRIEIYVPKDKRQYGYYVLPILHDDKLIGRIDPLMNRKTKTLHINAIYAEPSAPEAAGNSVKAAIEELAAFLGAKTIDYRDRIPPQWQHP
jgi:uncharacterized protein